MTAASTAVITADPPPLLSRATRVLDLREVAAGTEAAVTTPRGNGSNGSNEEQRWRWACGAAGALGRLHPRH